MRTRSSFKEIGDVAHKHCPGCQARTFQVTTSKGSQCETCGDQHAIKVAKRYQRMRAHKYGGYPSTPFVDLIPQEAI